MKFKVDKKTCQSATTCVAFTINDKPIYELDDENKAEIITANGKKVQDQWVDLKNINGVSGGNTRSAEKTIFDSAKSCPFNAIFVQDDRGKQIWPKE